MNKRIIVNLASTNFFSRFLKRYLVNVVESYDAVERAVQIIQKVNHL